jgi:hypothetical protein
MRTTVARDDQLVAKASEYTGNKERSVLLRMELESLIAREAGKRLAALGGSMPAHLMISAKMTLGGSIFAKDRCLQTQAERLGVTCQA